MAIAKTDESEVPWLLDELCSELGFCLRPDQREVLAASRPRDVDEFTDAVFIAEGLDPAMNKNLRSQVRDKVQRRLGAWLSARDL
jgi:hypothetical protein